MVRLFSSSTFMGRVTKVSLSHRQISRFCIWVVSSNRPKNRLYQDLRSDAIAILNRLWQNPVHKKLGKIKNLTPQHKTQIAT